MENNYTFKELQVGNKTVKYRNWKVKDRKKLKEVLKEISEISEKSKDIKDKKLEVLQKSIIDVLLYNCLDKEYALNQDEIQFVLNHIRSNSISQDVKFIYECKYCKTKNTEDLKVTEIHKPQFSDFKEIQVNNHKIEFSEIKNVKYYNSKMFTSEEVELDDLILHISKYNDDESLSYDDLKNIFENLDTIEMDAIFDEYNKMKFSLERNKEFKCGNCEKENKFIFDEIPDFLPENWILK